MDLDSDEFDDDLADEDLLLALEGTAPHLVQPTSRVSRPVPHHAGEDQSRHAANPVIDLDDLPSDAFSSPESSKPTLNLQNGGPRTGLARTSSTTFRQTTLWGGEVSQVETRQPTVVPGRAFRANIPLEEPSHHELDKEAMQTWVYPTNLGAIRDYQYSIVKNSLFNNTLVALPTGLGKTFIAATVMLNFHRWTKTAKIVFVAPTKPLVAQQVGACYSIAGIPRHETTLLTGDIAPALRVDEWQKRRVFFMTPQTLLNDISHGYADPKSIALLVIDEAHRAVGEYAYAKVAKMIRRFSKSIRMLALTATPGSKVETVQEVIDNLGISHCEIRTEESLDIRQYVHQRHIEQVILEPSDEMNEIFELFSLALKPLVEVLKRHNIWYGQNPMAINAFGLMKAQKEWFDTRGRHTNQGVQNMMRATFSVLTGIAHSIKLLNFHGIKPFYDNLVDLRAEQESRGDKGSKNKRRLMKDPNFQKMMEQISKWLRTDNFVGHPKLSALADCVLNHFMDRGNDSATRVIVFSEYRDSAEDIVRRLNIHQPLIKASVFVGQADSKRGEGMKQAQQIQTIERFRQGEFNVLVATSIGEEGLDIGQVDLIVCYDASASPIRMLQRMGRTGRKRSGQIVLLLMKGKEEDAFAKSKDNYEKMQKLICEGSRFNFRFDLSTRIVPRDIRPEVDKRHVEIPIENTQDPSLPEPKKRRAPAKKMPPKKFHMPDGVETGFQSVKDFMNPGGKKAPPRKKQVVRVDEVTEIPPLASVLLNEIQLGELKRSYCNLPFVRDTIEETEMPDLMAHPRFQRRLSATANFGHGRRTERYVGLMKKMGTGANGLVRPCRDSDTSNYLEIPRRAFVASDGESEETETPPAKAKEKKRRQAPIADVESGTDGVLAPKQTNSVARKRAAPTAQRKTVAARVSLGEDECDEDDDDGAPAPKRPKPAAPKRAASTTQRKTTAARATLEDDECEEGEDEDEDEDDSDSMTSSVPTPQLPGRKGKQQRKPRRRKGGINSDEIGDDCDRESDLADSDDSDDGADLVDFVVSDNNIPSTGHDLTATSAVCTSQTTPVASPKKPYYQPVKFSDSSESEDLPGIKGLGQKGRAEADNARDSSDGEARPAARAPRGCRRVVEESESDESF